VRGFDAHADLDVGSDNLERFKRRAIDPRDLLRRVTSFGRTGEGGGVSGRPCSCAVHRERAEVPEQQHRSPGDEHDHCVQRCHLTCIARAHRFPFHVRM
jgi:hypothetical protein